MPYSQNFLRFSGRGTTPEKNEGKRKRNNFTHSNSFLLKTLTSANRGQREKEIYHKTQEGAITL